MLRKYAAGSSAGSGALGSGISGTVMMVLAMGDIPSYFRNTADFGVLPDGLVGELELFIVEIFEPLRLKMPIFESLVSND